MQVKADSRLRLLGASLADRSYTGNTTEVLQEKVFAPLEGGSDEEPALVHLQAKISRSYWLVEPRDRDVLFALIRVWCANPRARTYFDADMIPGAIDLGRSLASLCHSTLIIEFCEGGFYYGGLINSFSLLGGGVGYAEINLELAQLISRECVNRLGAKRHRASETSLGLPRVAPWASCFAATASANQRAYVGSTGRPRNAR